MINKLEFFILFRRAYGNTIRCESHPDAPLVEDHRAGDLICTECGLVVGDRFENAFLACLCNFEYFEFLILRCIDVGSEWRTFANDKDSKDMSRVGAAEDPSMEDQDLSTTIGRATGAAGFGENGLPTYRNRNIESAAEKAKKANKEIKEMAERLSADQSIIVNYS